MSVSLPRERDTLKAWRLKAVEVQATIRAGKRS